MDSRNSSYNHTPWIRLPLSPLVLRVSYFIITILFFHMDHHSNTIIISAGNRRTLYEFLSDSNEVPEEAQQYKSRNLPYIKPRLYMSSLKHSYIRAVTHSQDSHFGTCSEFITSKIYSLDDHKRLRIEGQHKLGYQICGRGSDFIGIYLIQTAKWKKT